MQEGAGTVAVRVRGAVSRRPAGGSPTISTLSQLPVSAEQEDEEEVGKGIGACWGALVQGWLTVAAQLEYMRIVHRRGRPTLALCYTTPCKWVVSNTSCR